MLQNLWQLIWRLAGSPVVTPRSETTANTPWVELSLNAEREELPTTQKAAASWLSGLATFSGLAAVAGVSVGTNAIEGRLLLGILDAYWPGVLIIIGILFTSSIATLNAIKANSISWNTGSTDPDKLEEKWFSSIEIIRNHLTESRRWIKRAVVLLMVYALLVLLSVKPEEPKKPFAQVVSGIGVYCGQLITQADGKLAIHSRIGDTLKTQTTSTNGIELPGTVTDITSVSSCPVSSLPTQK